MSEHLQPGLHPDADSLNAFIEGVLPEHERLQCLAHIAECSRCREIVFLAQEPAPAPAASVPRPARSRWFAPVPVLAAAAAVCVAVLAILLYLRSTTRPPAREIAARVSPAPTSPSSTKPPQSVAPKPQAASPAPPGTKARSTVADQEGWPGLRTVVPSRTAPSPSLPPPPDIAVQTNSTPNQPLALPPTLPPTIAPPPPALSANVKADRGAAAGLSGIAGTVIDTSGAVIPGVAVHLRQLDGSFNTDTRTDTSGQFKLSGLPAGQYELEITATGFQRSSKHIDLQPREVATVRSELSVGSMAETVEITAASPTVQTETAIAMAGAKARQEPPEPPKPRPLPGKRSASITVTSGQVMLAVDSAGALFFSKNGGKHWKAIKPVWTGRVVQLVNLSDQAQFQLTTDTDTAWLSRDGRHWYPAPAQH